MSDELAIYFPNNAISNIIDDLAGIKSWDDFARRFLLGTGKSANTNATYLTACRQFYDFTGGLHPMQAGSPEWIEQFYDSLPTDLNTRSVKMAALRFMYRRICERFPFYTSPFEAMTEELRAKLCRSKKDASEKDALTEREYQGLLRMLRGGTSVRERQDYAAVRFAVTSGMRAAELCSLTWDMLSESEGIYKATFMGKGSKVRTIQLEKQAVEALRRAFRARYHRKPQANDYVLNSTGVGRGGDGISKAGLHVRLRAIVDRAKREGIIRNNLHVSTHTMRHTCATRLVAAGVPLDAVQRHLGHSNLSTTAVYLHNAVNLESYWRTMAGETTEAA